MRSTSRPRACIRTRLPWPSTRRTQNSTPPVAGDTLFAFTDVVERIDLGRDDAGALRLRLVAVKNQDPSEEEIEIKVKDPKSGREGYHQNVVLDLDYTVLMPRRPSSTPGQ